MVIIKKKLHKYLLFIERLMMMMMKDEVKERKESEATVI
jgi:hypothetical protein